MRYRHAWSISSFFVAAVVLITSGCSNMAAQGTQSQQRQAAEHLPALTVCSLPCVRAEYSLPNGGVPDYITEGADGNLWFTDYDNKIGKITTGGAVTEYATLSVHPLYIAKGADGNVWYSAGYFNGRPFVIGRVTRTGSITEFRLPMFCYTSCIIHTGGPITSGPDGNLWFAETTWNCPTRSCYPYHIVTGQAIARMTTSGVITASYSVPFNSNITSITTGHDGNLWFTAYGTNKIARMTTAGALTQFPLSSAGAGPYGIAPGPDGNLWFTEINANKVGRSTTAGAIRDFPVPAPSSDPLAATAGPDGNVWFTELLSNKVARVTTSGVITEVLIPTSSSSPRGITSGPDGNLWFTESGVGKIGKLVP